LAAVEFEAGVSVGVASGVAVDGSEVGVGVTGATTVSVGAIVSVGAAVSAGKTVSVGAGVFVGVPSPPDWATVMPLGKINVTANKIVDKVCKERASFRGMISTPE